MDEFSFLGQLRNRLQRLLRGRGRTREDAEDLIQEAFLKLQMYREKGNKVYQPEAFLVRTVLRLSINAHRDERRHLFADVPVEELPVIDTSPSPHDILAAEQQLDLMKRTLDDISERTREVFLLHRGDGLSYQQIAKLYGMTTKAVERRIAHAMLTLASKLHSE
jgi:RNA polymerase sigma factor (sigma-70 family)